jgi:hypothetical protein
MMKGAADRFRSGGTNSKIDRGGNHLLAVHAVFVEEWCVIYGKDYSYRRAIMGSTPAARECNTPRGPQLINSIGDTSKGQWVMRESCLLGLLSRGDCAT